ncbi:unnamed protein product, partial [Rotaria magnacalcarata]
MNRLFTGSFTNVIKRIPALYVNKQKSFVRKSTTASSISSNIDSVKDLSRPLPPYLYNDPSVYQLERENIFAKNWMYIGRL